MRQGLNAAIGSACGLILYDGQKLTEFRSEASRAIAIGPHCSDVRCYLQRRPALRDSAKPSPDTRRRGDYVGRTRRASSSPARSLRPTRHRFRLKGADRALIVWMTRLWPNLLSLSRVVQPGTVMRWHRAGFRAYWPWKSRRRSGRPGISRELRELIRQMSRQNPLWGTAHPR